MADATADWKTTLSLMFEAFRRGDNGRGEELLAVALDVGAPWDVATSTAAQAMGVSVSSGRCRAASEPAAS